MPIYRGLVLEQPRFVCAVRDRHDVHIFKFSACFAPIAMGQNVMTPDFAASFDFAPGRDRPMKQRVESRDAHAGLRRFHVLEKRGEAPNDLARAQSFRHAVKFIQTDSRFFRA